MEGIPAPGGMAAVWELRLCHSYYRQRPFPFTSLYVSSMYAKIRARTDADQMHGFACTVRASASQGGEIALDDTLCFDTACSNHLMVSPPLRGSNPYPCGSLTYRILQPYCRPCGGVCQPFCGKKFGRPAAFLCGPEWEFVPVFPVLRTGKNRDERWRGAGSKTNGFSAALRRANSRIFGFFGLIRRIRRVWLSL